MRLAAKKEPVAMKEPAARKVAAVMKEAAAADKKETAQVSCRRHPSPPPLASVSLKVCL